ncbi:MAG: hypothetical protein R2734_10470 [Nocardioides sp.]
MTAGAWRLYLLNSNCDQVDCDAEVSWLTQDLAQHPARCSALVMHYPRFSSGEHGSDVGMARFWAAGVRRARRPDRSPATTTPTSASRH